MGKTHFTYPLVLNYVAPSRVPGRTQSTPHPPFWNLIITPRPHPRMPPFFSFWGLGKIFGLFFWAASPMPIAPQDRHWMWASGHNGYSHAAHGYEATREAAMAAFAESWRRES